MAQPYLLIESRDPFDSGDLSYFVKTAKDLVLRGNDVILYLIQNAVLALRKKAQSTPVSEWIHSQPKGIRFLADDFSLRERGIRNDELIAGVKVSNVDALVDFLVEEKRKAVWH